LVSDDNSKLLLKAAHDSNYMERAKNIPYYLNWNAISDKEIDGITSWVAIRKLSFEANSWDEIIKHPSHKGKLDKIISSNNNPGKDFKNLFAIPLIRENEIQGVFKVENKMDGDFYDSTDKEIFELTSKYIMLILETQNRIRKTVSHIAHLSRSPIAEAVLNLSLLENKGILMNMDKHQITETMRVIKNALLQANTTITNLIILSTTRESKDSRLSGNRSSITESINKVINLFEAFITNIRFSLNIKGNLLLSPTEQIMLEIILQNVIHNSIKYSKPSIGPKVDINGKDYESYYRITIRDYGIGIAKEDMDNVFTEFSRGGNSKYDNKGYGSVKGFGIGLSSIKKICEDMRWIFELHSSKGYGTTFILQIPRKETL